MSNPPTEQAAPAEIGLDQIAGRLAALDAGGAPPKAPSADGGVDAIATADGAIETTADVGGEADAQALPPAEAQAPDAEPTEESTEDAESGTDTITVKIDGKVMQVSLKEAAAGYQRQADYSRKMNALRTEAQSVQAEKQQVMTERAQYSQLLGALRQQLEALTPQEPDWARLHREDPINYPLIRDQWRETKEKLSAIQAEQSRLAAQAQAEQSQQLHHVVVRGQQLVREKFAEWKDEKTWETARQQLRAYGQAQGYSDQELSQAYDPRAIILLEKARRYDALMANRPKPQQAASGPKPLRAGSAVNSPKASTDITRMKQRLSKTGRVEDAAVLFGLLDGRR
jgi:head-tail adaptor